MKPFSIGAWFSREIGLEGAETQREPLPDRLLHATARIGSIPRKPVLPVSDLYDGHSPDIPERRIGR